MHFSWLILIRRVWIIYFLALSVLMFTNDTGFLGRGVIPIVFWISLVGTVAFFTITAFRVRKNLQFEDDELILGKWMAYIADSSKPNGQSADCYGHLSLTEKFLIFRNYEFSPTLRIPLSSIRSVTVEQRSSFKCRGPWLRVDFDLNDVGHHISWGWKDHEKWAEKIDEMRIKVRN